MSVATIHHPPSTIHRAAGPHMQHRSTHHRPMLKRAEGQPPRVEGYGAVYFDANDPGTEYALWDDFIERIAEGCFDRCIAEKHAARSFVNHNPDRIIGRVDKDTLELRVDKKGLFYSAQIPDTTSGQDLIKDLENGNIDGSSFAFDAMEWAYEDKRDDDRGWIRYRYLKDCYLHEVGPVCMPAYEATTAGSRSSAEMIELAAEHEAWRRALASSDADDVAVRLVLMRLEDGALLSDMH